jgi:transposase
MSTTHAIGSTPATVIFTMSCRDMIEALIAGQRDPRAPTDLARGKMRAKRKALIEALDGKFEDHHACDPPMVSR